MATCPGCRSELDPASIRCVVCGRVVTRNRQELLRTRALMMQANVEDQKHMSREQRAVLNSWMYAKARATQEKVGLADRVTDLVLNSVVMSMSSIAIMLFIIYFIVYYYPEQSYKAMISMGLVRIQENNSSL